MDGVDQYKSMYDYVNAVRKHNLNSTALVKVFTGLERPKFQSMFMF